MRNPFFKTYLRATPIKSKPSFNTLTDEELTTSPLSTGPISGQISPILRTWRPPHPRPTPSQTGLRKRKHFIMKGEENLPHETILYKFSLKLLILSSIFRQFRLHRTRENVWNKFRKQSRSHLNPLCKGRKRFIKEIIQFK